MHYLRFHLTTLLFLTVFLSLAGCATVSPERTIVKPTERTGRISEITIPAPSLAGNVLGDPIEQRVAIYLPPGYENNREKRYPVLYLLHGFTGTQQTWLIAPDVPKVKSMANNSYQWEGFLTREMLDRKFESGGLPPMIIVAPNGRNALKHSFYVNSPVTGNWEDYIVQDVINYIDTHFRTISDAASRGIAGHSGGGNGAIFLAMRHADKFGSVYAAAPCCLGETFSLPPMNSKNESKLNAFWQTVYGRLADLSSLEELPDVFTRDMRNFWTNVEVAAAAAYAPNPDRPPFYGDHLYERRNGEFVRNNDAFKRRWALASFHEMEDYIDDLKSLRGIFIDYGEFEWDELSAGNAEFVQALSKNRIPFHMEIYADGDHGNLIAERMESHGLAFFADTLVTEPE